MAISGTVPQFDYSSTANGQVGAGSVIGYLASGATALAGSQATQSTESLPETFLRWAGYLGQISGAASGGTGRTAISGSLASGIRNIQQELVARYADITGTGQSNAAKLDIANDLLTASGEFRFSIA
jgi:hypothetical protein